MDTESVRLRDGDAGLQNPSRSLDKHGKISYNYFTANNCGDNCGTISIQKTRQEKSDVD